MHDIHHVTKVPSPLSKMIMKVSLILGIGGLVALLIYSEIDRRNIKETQKLYHAQIATIKEQLNDGNCTEAEAEYSRAKQTRNSVFESGLYYSIEPFAKQAHAIEIAECFAQDKDFYSAVKLLDEEAIDDADYLRKASEIYKTAGENEKAQEARVKAEKFDLTK
ncbi:MAG TPA: hypothetical protein VFX57_06385 [Sulfuricurvum sp.]|nr:hypothetical protein [Sulfuricurvum sp.]